ncbi:hypothetical protein ACJIZ3_001733 [Penstemon smallii]|uniref:Calmodulin-binding domain-containing protein n=1 Tax=Penstemon smallii TaxID=265156 RepID=A0ABD3U7C4_9LAMI
MATRTKESAPGREKRGISPSNIPITGTGQHRRSPNTSKTNSPAKNHDSTSSEKHVPNYLKPTKSSGVDVSKQQGKKPLLSESAHKPILSRRSSFDKPPSPSRIQKSPNPTLRSSSFSGKTMTSQKLVPEKNLRATKDAGKQRSLYARPVNAVKKTTSIYVKKQGTESSTATRKEQVTSLPEKVDNPNAPDVMEPEPQSEDQESSITEAEELDRSNDEKNTEIPAPEDQEPINIEQIEAESDNDANIVTVESPTVLEQEDVSVEEKTEEHAEEKSKMEETNSKQQELVHSTNEINSNITTDESVAGKPTEEAKEEEETILDKKEETTIGSEAPESEETEVHMEEKKGSEKAAPKPQVAHGKKDAALSNDVIEETASKLREQRKNKVKALAGAFETVISLQDPK